MGKKAGETSGLHGREYVVTAAMLKMDAGISMMKSWLYSGRGGVRSVFSSPPGRTSSLWFPAEVAVCVVASTLAMA